MENIEQQINSIPMPCTAGVCGNEPCVKLPGEKVLEYLCLTHFLAVAIGVAVMEVDAAPNPAGVPRISGAGRELLVHSASAAVTEKFLKRGLEFL